MDSSSSAATVPPLFSPEFQRDPYPTYRHHLSGPTLQPLALRPGVWMVFGYETCTRMLRDPRLSAARPPSQLVAVSEEALREFDDVIRHMSRWLLLRDPPRHSELRKMMNRGFTPAVIEDLAPKVQAVIDRLLNEVRERETFDLIKDFAYPLPVRVICELLGLPEELHDRCVVLSDDIALWMGDPRRPPDLARTAQHAVRELEGYFAETIRRRRGTRNNDLLGLLLDAAAGGDAMSEEELHAQCVMLLFGGHETTRNLIGNGVYTLLTHPEACAELRNDERLLPSAIEELLRYESPVQAFGRATKADLELDGVKVPAGSGVMFMIGAAHRDPRQYADPDRLDLGRRHNRHLAFGGDAHVCLGSTLARLEGRLSIGALIRRFPALRLTDERPDWGRNFAFRGLSTLRVAN
ncbi:MAG TPA: cytochrome P450 [Steroidobacteraceae bacterium]|nr:cytochrome P450 [Steroidobacteraceae bacterium]